MTSGGPLARTPYFFLGPRPYVEAEYAAHIRREHARGRDLSEILSDRRLKPLAGRGVLRAVLVRPALIRAIGEDVAEAIREDQAKVGDGPALGGPLRRGDPDRRKD